MFRRHLVTRLSKIQPHPLAKQRPFMASKPLIMNSDAERVVNFWFNRPPMEWIIAPDGLDDQLKNEFRDLTLKARQNELDDWIAEPGSCLALVAMLDQFSRNIFRGSPDAFTADSKAWETSVKAIARGFDGQVSVIQATAFYMPLMHQESLISLIAANRLFEALKPRCVSEEEHKWVDMGVAASKRHMQQLEQFGRYPTRNALLGRKNTEAEEVFLKEHMPAL